MAKAAASSSTPALLSTPIKWAIPKIGFKPLPTRGSVDNVPLLEAGTVDIGLVFGEMAQELLNPKSGAPTQLKVITTAYSSAGMFVVRADSRYRTIKDLMGRPVVWNGRGFGAGAAGTLRDGRARS